MSNKRYHKENCISKVRAIIIDQFGNEIMLTGTHAFEWSITVKTPGKISITTYNDGKIARKNFKELVKKRGIKLTK